MNGTQNKTLIDKVIFSNIRIANIMDMSSLEALGIIENTNSKIKYVTDSGQEFTRLTLKGFSFIDELSCGAMYVGTKMIYYCNLSTSIHNERTGNLYCFDVSDYRERIDEIYELLLWNYGIELNVSDICLKEIEINRTFKLEHDFKEYYRPCCLIMHNLPYYFKHQKDCKVSAETVDYDTFYAFSGGAGKSGTDLISKSKSKRCMVFKIYNKSKALQHIIMLSDSFMRIELRLIGTEKVKKALGTNRFYEITDEIIDNYYSQEINKLIIKPLEKWKAQRDKDLSTLINNQLTNDKSHWITNTLRLIANKEIEQKYPMILDVHEITDIMSKIKMDSKKRYKIKKAFFDQAEKFESAFCKDDHLKLKEIIDKLTYKEVRGDIPKGDTQEKIISPIFGRTFLKAQNC